ncbi:MAG: hypothetical protein JNK79_13610 [Chitinophagaceae bacterium]|nr:hypothetical protein [Chitinophagaceae bacterium]
MQEQNMQRRNKFLSNNRWTGLILLLVGAVLLLRQVGYPLPGWLISWEMILIVVGLVIGVRHGFKDFSWLVMILVGVVFLSDDVFPEIKLKQYAVPIIIISVGLLFVLSPKKMCGGHERWRRRRMHRFGGPQHLEAETLPIESEATQETELDITSIFAGVKKRVLSKQFKGGDITCVFGGAELNLMNADFISPVMLDVTMIFGGTKLIIPPNWELRSEVTAIFGGVDDKRPQASGVPEKVIILTGTLMFGGIEVNSFSL